MMKIKRRIYEIISPPKNGDVPSIIFDISIIIVVITNVLIVIIDTFHDVPASVQNIFPIIDTLTLIIFTIEYILRLWTADFEYPNKNRFQARIKYIVSFMAIIDLMSIPRPLHQW